MPEAPFAFHPTFQRVRFVLVEPTLAANIGAAARAIKTMGFSRLVVVKPKDPDYRSDPDAVKAEVLAAGFQFVGSSDVIANPADDHKSPVFEKGLHDKTDRYVLKFRRPK